MTHPTDLLVDLVDGTIAEHDRAGVEAHLASCARCRAEVADATAAREALRGLEIPQVPASIGDAASAEAERAARARAPEVVTLRRPGGRRRGGGEGVPPWYRWAAAAAATAAVLLVAVMVLPNIGGDGDVMSAESGPGGRTSTAMASGDLEIQDADYDTALVEGLALSYRALETAEASPVDGGTSAVDVAPDLPTGRIAPQRTDEALTCLRTAFADASIEPVRLIEARFDGTPAYLGVVLLGPGAGQAPDRVQVLVAARDGCTILTTTQVLL
jgi:hypothetical protein